MENTLVKKLGGAIKASAVDKEIAERAVEDLKVALGILAERLVSEIDESAIAALSNPRYIDRFDSSTVSSDSDLTEPEIEPDDSTVALPDPRYADDIDSTISSSDSDITEPGYVPYVVEKKMNYHRVCIRHGDERLFEHDKVRNRIRAIKIMVQQAGNRRAADVFVDAVVIDLENERAKHKGLSRRALVEWANALYKARLMEAHRRGVHTDPNHKFERKLWVAVSRVLSGQRQKVLNDEDI